MALTKRILRVTISLPSGDIVLDEKLSMRVSVNKAALAIQNRATIEVMGMSTSLRLQLLSQFTAFHKRKVESGSDSQDWIGIKIEAGYLNQTNDSASSPNTSTSVIFIGHVVNVDPGPPPPNIGVRIQAYTRQIDKTSYVTQRLPSKTTFRNLVQFAAEQMGFGNNFICDTSFNDRVISNGFGTVYTQGQLLLNIQDAYRPNVIAFVDDDQLIVKDRNKAIDPSNITEVTEFIGTPIWNEWGVSWQTLMDPTIKLVNAAKLTSSMNPGINGTYVIYELNYQLASREPPFYVKASAALSA